MLAASTTAARRPGPGARSPDSWRRAGVRLAAAGAFLIPLAPSPVTFDQFALPRLVLARLLVAGLLALWLGGSIRSGRVTIRRTPLDIALLALIASAALSTLLAVNGTVAVFGAYLRYEGLLTIGTYCLLFWLVAQTLAGPRDVRAVVIALLASAYVLSLLAIAQSLLAGRTAVVETTLTFDGWTRADATFGSPTLLGTYLAMLLPLALREVVHSDSALARALAANVALTMAAALLLTFTRGAWLGAAAGVAVALLPAVRRFAAARGAAVAAGLGALALTVAAAAGAVPPVLATAGSRAASLLTPLQGTGGFRVAVWRDTLPLVAARPVAGWGPDTFGLVHPMFRSAPTGVVDKAHSDLLQVAATQGLIGVAATLVALGALGVAFWRGRRSPGAFALLGALVAYEASVQFEFAWVPVTAPFWILAAAATTAWAGAEQPRALGFAIPTARAVRAAGVVFAALLPVAVAVLLAGLPLAADALSFQGMAALARGDVATARARIGQARLLAPYQSTYAAEAGDVAMDLRPGGGPGPRADASAARGAYLEAARLGTGEPLVYERLATADRALGRIAEADDASRTARRLAG
ncbi:MAG TPA: O-antigen ligase family protein [Candidatus Dormibacteraeota bacterium]|nr:O-antigen ligase family protein [Candidatus Dormibacteraeota bacterium]